jgi:LuxR family maltose regulon positive regulatory protein
MPERFFPGSTDPETRRYLERPRVDQLLEKALQSRLTTVVAGEGNGKSYAVHSFLQKNPRAVIWVQVSERDNLRRRFWENYTGGIARLSPEAAKIFTAMGFPETDQQFDRYLTLLKSEIISRDQYVIVFDDFHLITNPVICRYLERTLAAPVSGNHAVLISRIEPAVNTVGFLARGMLSRITTEDLRFNEEEIGEYLRLNQLSLDAGDIARICRDTEGWAMAVDLIVQEMKTDSPGQSLNWDRMMRPIRNVEEGIFAGMDGELQKFLIKLSLIEHWPRDLLEGLDPGGKNTGAMEKFTSLIRFDAYLQGFRIHHLFLEFLREKQGDLSQEEIRQVYARDAQWCIENGLPMDAVVDYERAGDYGGLLRVINFLHPLLSGEMASFFLETLERLIPPVREDENNRELLFLWFIFRPRFLMFLGRFNEAAGELRKAISLFKAWEPGPQRSRSLTIAYNTMAILNLLSCRFTGDYGFSPWFELASRYSPEANLVQVVSTYLNVYVFQVGYPSRPEKIASYIDNLAAAIPYASEVLNGFLYGADALARAELAYYQGDIDKAERFAFQAVYQSREKKQYEVENRSLFYLMLIDIHKGDATGIRDLQRQLENQLEIPEYRNRYVIHDIAMGGFYARIGLTDKIAPWLRGRIEEGEFNGVFRGFDVLIKARCFFFEGEYLSALKILEEERARDDLGSFLLGLLDMTVLEAVIRCQLDDPEGAFGALKRAYDIATLNALDMPFIEMGEYTYKLINALLKAYPEEAAAGCREECGGIPRHWLQNTRSKASAYAKKRSLAVAQYADGEDPYFMRRELAILDGLSQGFTIEEIAGHMKISISMVKSALRSVCVKLGAVNRADAVRIAAVKGLLKNP